MPNGKKCRVQEETIERYAMGRLAGSRLARLEEHLLLCEACQGAVQQADLFLAGLRHALREAADDDRRRAPRLRCRRKVIVIVPGEPSILQGKAVDRSETGFGVRLAAGMPPGARVLVSLGATHYQGQVAWCVPQGMEYRLGIQVLA